MTYPVRNKKFLNRYFPVYAAALMLSCFSFSLAIALASLLHFKTHPDLPEYIISSLVVCSLLLSVGNMLQLRGRRSGMWLVVMVLGACMLLTLSTYGPRTPMPLFTLALLAPLLALLLFNSERHREMRRRLMRLRERENRGRGGFT
ncbi:hypothetical protein LOY54_17325 [Pseudomonas sp. B21-032]|uniref:hypothetical protein n=1 Tax=Pseudomonas sp. B21-032 TaxID=2895483 RepID=UPI00215E0C33|nr:hypothetical protein [Pseudomonas sp. B21-032]UVL59801.1 hypothetical protein LOY54_17325 [Pseudomonas sp. B21-032]